ncbi:MAG: UxaA family hydrolase [Candidatus Dormibacteraceae bacterium]
MSSLAGFARSGGRWGIRNHVLVLPLHSAANLAAERIVEGVPEAVAVGHQWEARADDPDFARIAATLAGYAANPNVYATVMIGILAADTAIADLATSLGGQVHLIAMADHRGTAGTVAASVPLVARLTAEAAALKRTPMPLAGLVMGLECGGSDALSGITANPALGVASDLLLAAGGTSILAETPELIGAEEILAARAVSPAVGRQVIETIRGFEKAIRDLGVDVRGAQPTPGNQAGGLTTIEEKSLGAAKKGGDAPVAGVVGFAQAPAGPGLWIMDTPGHDIEQMVGMVAGGANIACFTTGRGTPTGSAITPVIKISTNTAIFERLSGDIDIDAGAILDGSQTLATMGARIHELVLAVAAGELTSSERRGNHEFAISRTVSPMTAFSG